MLFTDLPVHHAPVRPKRPRRRPQRVDRPSLLPVALPMQVSPAFVSRLLARTELVPADGFRRPCRVWRGALKSSGVPIARTGSTLVKPEFINPVRVVLGFEHGALPASAGLHPRCTHAACCELSHYSFGGDNHGPLRRP